MDKLFDWLIGKTDRKHWLIFSVVLSVITIYFIDKIHEDLWSWHLFWYIIPYFNFNPTHLLFEDGKNLTFLVSEILLTSMALTRVLIAFDILHIIQRTPIVADVINLVIRERRERLNALVAWYQVPVGYPIDDYWNSLCYDGIWDSQEFLHEYIIDDYITLPKCRETFLQKKDMSRTMCGYMKEFDKIAVVKYSDIGPIMPAYIRYFIDQHFYGYFLCNKPLFKIKNREIKLGDIYALFAMLFAIYTIYVV